MPGQRHALDTCQKLGETLVASSRSAPRMRQGSAARRRRLNLRGTVLKAQFDMLARYNAFANRRLYDACGALSDEDYRADHGAFFKSVHGTLNHLLVTDRIWLARFTGEGETPHRLDAILFETFHELRAAREAEDCRICACVEGLDEAGLYGVLAYRRVSTPDLIEQELWTALTHFFNHQTLSSRSGARPALKDSRTRAGA